jgi:hypothetical protein
MPYSYNLPLHELGYLKSISSLDESGHQQHLEVSVPNQMILLAILALNILAGQACKLS